ncbi:BtpA/SgcQ family protein [Leptolyngbya sp. 7M]|uniref:BtpA/SgcQ family protein n=1 Tax=Leptolyngbya sp. 7M TaxID=2812896 RepID=UPI001B8B7E2B|nr:BtpA/SgcQ family protein [Leptolyngbya sp. 7M]QYO64776.1 BtpA/SgcQ family protein [Leptolyngbya sp. 7M]
MDLKQIFKTANPIIGVVHLLPLPTSPRWGGNLKAVIDRAEQEATALASGGVDGIIVENFFDAPFPKDAVDPAVVSAMSLVVQRLMHLVTLPIGINVLRNDAHSAMAIASCVQAQFIRVNVENGVVAKFSLQEEEMAVFVLQGIESGAGCGLPIAPTQAKALFKRTVDYWQRWLSQCTYKGRWREIVERSALVLKLLTYEPTGAIVAAPTCSLPELIGGERNWDYRYTWIRDASFTVYGLLRIGFTEEAAQFMTWLESRCREPNPDGSLQIMYGIDGRHQLTEEMLDHLEGYQGSSPVRIGNGAYNQLQLDIYGELMDSVYLYNKYGQPISYDLWTHLQKLIDWVCDNWQRRDEGVWEVRGGQQHFVYSKLMCWVALDRGIRLADKRSFPADRNRWLTVRNQIYEEIMEKGWSETRQAFVQHYDTESLDASSLIMSLVFFMSPTDPRMLATLDAINRSPQKGGLVSNSLVYRYNTEQSPDGLKGHEGTFNMCTFWLVEALARAGRTSAQNQVLGIGTGKVLANVESRGKKLSLAN